MYSTPLLKKPVIYGSELADISFVILIILHILPALLVFISGIVALIKTKGSKEHIFWGKVFIISMIATASSGILLDIIRLSFFIEENHTKYIDHSMPSTFPARFAFLYAGFCIFYLIKISLNPGKLNFSPHTTPSPNPLYPGILFFSGIYLTWIIYSSYNPWTGALWIIWTFMCLVIATGFLPYINQNSILKQTQLHRIGMLSMISFSWWGAFQGFGPAIGIRIFGVNNSISTYTGNLPGYYSHSFFFFLLPWLFFFSLGVCINYYFIKKRNPA